MKSTNKHSEITKEIFTSAKRMIILIVVSILIIELGLMILMRVLPPFPGYIIEFLESILLVILIIPELYFLVYRPMINHLSESILLKEDALKFKLGIENSTNAIFITDPQGIITYANTSFENIYGFSQEEIIGHTPRIIKSGILTPDIYENFWATLLKKETIAGEIINKKKDGQLITIDGTNDAILDPSGKIIGFLGVHRDITQRKRVELENQILYEIGQGVSTTSDLSELLKLIHHSLGKVMYADNCFFALHDQNTDLFSFPYFVDEFDTTPPPVKMAKSCTAYVFRSGKSLLLTSEIFSDLKKQNEVELVGSPAPSWIGVPLKTSSRTIGVLVLQHYEIENLYSEYNLHFLDSIASQVANVIDRKRAEEDLGISFSLLTATLESTADAILVVGKNGKITDFNKRFIDFWHIPDSLMSTRDDDKVLSFVLNQLKDPEGFLKKIDELYLNDEEISSDIIEFKDGRVFDRYSQSQRFENKPVGRVWSFRDITNRVHTENALLENEAHLKELNATKDKFFSIISHDLKSPFNSIIGFSSILVEQVKEKDYEGIEQYAQIIQSSSQRTMALLMNLLEWSRSQTGRMEFTPEYVEMGSLINEVTDLLNDAAEHKSITISKEIGRNLTAFIDKAMISTVLRNLISNAIKFTNMGGKILISSQQNDHELIISVSDNGVGIKKKAMNELFRIEESSSTLGTKNEKGTGLGLILCKEFVGKHKGKIWVESDPGKGSTFHFTLPKA
jgi:PAS domain S-box-containing protein